MPIKTRLKKRLGQHLLVDKNIIKKIISYVAEDVSNGVIEIGSGQGALSIELAKSAKKLICVDIDKNMCVALADKLKSFKNTEVVCCDILKFSLSSFKKCYVLGNIPYNITSSIIAYLIKNRNYLDGFTLMVQKEFAQRLLAEPGTKDYGAFTCFVNYFTQPKTLFKITRGCFIPRPKVDSAIVRFAVRKKPKVFVENEEMFFKIIRTGFNQRRKTLVNSLKVLIDKAIVLDFLRNSNLPENIRAENLQLEDFARLTSVI